MQHTVSSKTLVKASLAAIVVGVIVLVTLILPAEYNLDPTGIGQKLGLTKIAQASQTETAAAPLASTGSNEFQTIEISIPAGRGVEYKFAMAQY